MAILNESYNESRIRTVRQSIEKSKTGQNDPEVARMTGNFIMLCIHYTTSGSGEGYTQQTIAIAHHDDKEKTNQIKHHKSYNKGHMNV
jgi:hypothetical protein